MTCLSAGNLKCFAAKLKMLTICTAKTLVLKAIKRKMRNEKNGKFVCLKSEISTRNSFLKR